MSQDWAALDSLLKWHKRKEPSLPARIVHTEKLRDGDWQVLSERGSKRTGNQDLLALVQEPSGTTMKLESFKSIVDDILLKCDAHRDYMKQSFMPAFVEIVVLGSDPGDALPDLPAPPLPGLDIRILLNVLQVIALTEHRKYSASEPVGGKYLAVRLCAGICWGVWTASDITWGILKQNAVAVLRAQTGIREPTLGKVLATSAHRNHFELERSQLEALSL